MTYSDRRKQKRYKIWVDVEVQTPETSILANATEISGDGMRIYSQQPIQPGTKISIVLKVEEKVVVDGTLLWTLDSNVSTGNAYEMGVKTDIIFYEGIKVNKFSTRAEAVQRIVSRF